MEPNDIITTFQLVWTALYVAFIYIKFGVLTSISASTYYLEGNQKWLFLGWLWPIAFLNFFQGLGAFGFIAGAGIAFTGITVYHSEDRAKSHIIHLVATLLGIVASFGGLWFHWDMWWPAALFAVTLIPTYKKKNFIWIAECIAFALVFASYYIHSMTS